MKALALLTFWIHVPLRCWWKAMLMCFLLFQEEFSFSMWSSSVHCLQCSLSAWLSCFGSWMRNDLHIYWMIVLLVQIQVSISLFYCCYKLGLQHFKHFQHTFRLLVIFYEEIWVYGIMSVCPLSIHMHFPLIIFEPVTDFLWTWYWHHTARDHHICVLFNLLLSVISIMRPWYTTHLAFW